MILGEDAIIISKDDAVNILVAINKDWTKENIMRLQKIGALEIVDFLRDAVKDRD